MSNSHTYNFICKCRAELNVEISREIDFAPKCLKCGSTKLTLKYSIINGDIWMNESIMHE